MTPEINGALPILLRAPLLDAASRVGLDCCQIRRILWSIVAPSTLNDLPEVLSKLDRVLLSAERQWPGTLTKFDLVAWPSIISTLKPIVEQFACARTQPLEGIWVIVVATTQVNTFSEAIMHLIKKVANGSGLWRHRKAVGVWKCAVLHPDCCPALCD